MTRSLELQETRALVTSRTADALDAIRAYPVAGVTHVLFTHLDETTSCGSVLTVSGVEARLPLSYLGIGPEIPADTVPANAHDVVRRTLSHGEHRA